MCNRNPKIKTELCGIPEVCVIYDIKLYIL